MVYIIILGLIYIVPVVTAYENNRKNKVSVLVINIFLGWTIIGWIVALAMAVASDKDKVTIVQKDSHSTGDEIKKLLQLKEEGAITKEEYQKQKEKLLS